MTVHDNFLYAIPMYYGKIQEQHDTRFSVHESIHWAGGIRDPRSESCTTSNTISELNDKKLFLIKTKTLHVLLIFGLCRLAYNNLGKVGISFQRHTKTTTGDKFDLFSVPRDPVKNFWLKSCVFFSYILNFIFLSNFSML